MCGILFSTVPHDLTSLIRARGPNFYGKHESQDCILEAAVLALREPVTEQPLLAGNKALAYNGEIYGTEGNDSEVFFSQIQNSVEKAAQIEGEFAFIYWDDDLIWFGRDRLGRRSLMYSLDNGLLVTSVGGTLECGAGTLYKYSLSLKTLDAIDLKPEYRVSRSIGWTPNEQLLLTLQNAVQERTVCPTGLSKVAVLFSGGLDCTIITRLLDMVLPEGFEIDLLNVAFENRRANTMWETPDRLLARRSLSELRALSSRTFNLEEVNVPYEEALESHATVKRLMWPQKTVMDLSIAMAFYFAADGGQSTTPILFSGLGADELFAGYSRHLGAYTSNTLAEELELDFGRIGTRNLGRDDRVSACWGKEIRYPFLSEAVVAHALALPLDAKTDGETTKIALRHVAKALGLGDVCNEKKRAIQFGARSAKMDPGSGKAKGHNILD